MMANHFQQKPKRATVFRTLKKMNRQLYSWEVFVAFALALVSQTAYRFDAGFGIGELCLALFIGVVLIQIPFQNYKNIVPPHLKYVKFFFVFLVVAVTPITLINSYSGLEGSSPRDVIAYFISMLFVFSFIVRRLNFSLTGIYFSIFFIAICLMQFLIGGDKAWYAGLRFVGGAKNPNQLALYIVCLLVILPTLELGVRWKILIAGSLVILGLASRSDALNMTFALIILAWISMYLVPRPRFFWFLLLISFPVFFGIYFFFVETSLVQQVTEIWTSADEGNTRLGLYINGLKAYSSTPAAWPFGFGAGAYSGEDGPFGAREAHNTPIDFLTVGGIVGVFLLYAPILRGGWAAYCQRWHLLAAIIFGLFVFSLFHFVARHPVFWFAIVSATHALYKHRLETGKQTPTSSGITEKTATI